MFDEPLFVFEQPCKKSRKDGGGAVVKTITSYFSPMPKPVEKPFSPPRSNNIMSYFSRKTPPEKSSLPKQSKETCRKSQPAEKQTSSERRKRKKTKAAKKLVSEAVSLIDESSCVIVEETHENENSTADSVSRTLSSDTAAQLSKLHAVSSEPDISDITVAKSVSDKQNEGESPPEGGSRFENKLETVPNTCQLSPTVPSKTKRKPVKPAARNTKKRQQKETKCCEPEGNEAEGSLCGDSMEVHVDEASQLNSSTVTISFEDFVRSQNKVDIKDDKTKEDDDKNTTEAEKLNTDVTEPKDCVSPAVPSVQISPRTVTIQAEVHASKQETVRAVGKLASIFTKRKGSSSPAEIVSSPHVKYERQTPSPSVKQKSNVVLQEEDLELAVIESESTPRCSEAERKQFMAAFKQPSLDGSKTKAVKSQGKQKQSEEKTAEAADKTTDDVIVSPRDQVSQNKETKRKRKRGKNKVKGEEAAAASPAVEETVTIVEDDKKDDPPATSSPSAPALRRSRREAVLSPTPEATAASPARKTRRQKESKTEAAVSPEDSPVKLSTPKTRRSKHGVFVAQMIYSPNTKESPIK